MKRKEKRAAFAIGAIGYPVLEVWYRGRTHWSMAVAGGLGFTCIYRIHQSKRSLLRRCARGAVVVTGVELVTGLVVNRLLRLRVWDYSKRRFNLLGQVCPAYAAVWFGLCAVLSPACRVLGRVLRR